ncbi:MAG: DUF433 domain-containing protein [Nitrospinae bacterium]|nr:DUF433 domain-containing protein [Nitrospinota bacterium]MCG2809130.1 DUF433 domain-containing protein [Candidatus Portnoybacteria bacterium]
MRKIIINQYIVADPSVCHGKPTFKGTRVMVWQILDMLEDGASIKDILKAFPSLTKKHIQSALAYATDLTRGENYVLLKV